MTWDPHQRLVTIDEAAELIERPASTVRRWISERRLTPFAHQGYRALYLEADVLRVDAALSVPRRTMKYPATADTVRGVTD